MLFKLSEFFIKSKDIMEKSFIALDDVFADIFNVLVFEGRQVVTPDSLEDVTGVSRYKADDAKLHEQERPTVPSYLRKEKSKSRAKRS